MTTTKNPPVRLTLTLTDGTRRSFELARMPKHWQSWLIQQLPYGTPYTGASFTCEPIA
jgi:hypothetical protein